MSSRKIHGKITSASSDDDGEINPERESETADESETAMEE